MICQCEYNKVHEIQMKHKKCIGKSLKIDETQEMYRGIPKSYKLF
jgi:hypothetical protein